VDVDEDYRPRFAAKVIDLEVLEQRAAYQHRLVRRRRPGQCLPRAGSPIRMATSVRACPTCSARCSVRGLFCARHTGAQVAGYHFPDAFLASFDGPRFGIGGLRERWNIHRRPFFFGVIKPNIGLAPEPFAALAEQAWLGGLDIAKDDEMLADPDWSPLATRATLLGAARERAEAATGERKVYLANITDEVDRLCDLHDTAVAAGAGAVMLNALPVGLSAARMLRRHAQVPLVAHFPLIAAASRLPTFGVHTRVLTRLQRLAGFDVIIMPGFGERMMTTAAEVRDNIAACTEPMGAIRPSLPAPGGSDSAATLARVHRQVGSVDFGFVPGRGVFSHPMGPRGGAASLRQAWEAIADGTAVADAAAMQPELAAALDAFGPPQE
jgi:ribulose-bisphosphate carboxylase large chain